MGIMRWSAEADTSITNAFKEGLATKGVKANMGLADSLEVFVLHGQVAATGTDSKEIARILIRFNMADLRASLVAGDVPNPGASNKPKYLLRLFNAVHPETLPKNFTLNVHTISTAWDEGTGIDMSEYSDEGAASWTYASNTAGAAGTGKITVQATPSATTVFTVKIDGDSIQVTTPGSPTPTNVAEAIRVAVNSGTSKVSATADAGVVTLTAAANGATGNYRYDVDTTEGTFTTASYYMTGGLDFTEWGTAMAINAGDYGGSAIGTQTFSTGEEDLLIDITSHMESVIWNSGSLRSLSDMQTSHKGFIIKISDESVSNSFYTKKFFARSSQYFFKRPCIEARWDASEQDQRAKFYAESKMLTNEQNTNSVFLYNSVGGSRSNYTFPTDEELYVRFYTDPDYTQLASVKNPDDSFNSATSLAATNPSTGVYKVSCVVDTTGSYVYDKWYSAATGGADESTWEVVHTGEIAVQQRNLTISEKKDRYIFSITNLKNSYSRSEKPRFRVYTRLKDWSPTIYTVARRSLQNKIVDNVYFKIFRVVDDEVVFDYGRGTATTNSDHTKLSYDYDGSYFDFDISLLEAGYMYGIRFLTAIDGVITEQEEVFKFRVD